MSPNRCQVWLVCLYVLFLSSSSQVSGGEVMGSPATLEQQLVEKKVLLSMVTAFGNHPVFRTIGWVEQSGGATYNDTLPCSQSAPWFYVKCADGYIIFLQLDSEAYSYPNSGQNAAGGISPPGNVSFAKGIAGVMGPITGEIPWPEIMKLTKLGYLSMSSNNLYGRAVPEYIDGMTSLQHLSLANNNLNGTIPASITNMSTNSTGLAYLDLSQNRISGPLPSNMDTLSHLHTLNLYQNAMTGTLPPELGKSTSLQNINIGQNNFNGTLTETWSMMTQLNYLNLASCEISGSISSSFSSLTNLKQLILSHNNISGPFPNFTGSLIGLQFLELGSNDMYGPLPANLWDPPSLAYVDVSFNFINGSIPASPPNRKYLTTAYQSNCFDGFGPLNKSMRTTTECSTFYHTLEPGFVIPSTTHKSSLSSFIIVIISMVALLLVLVAAGFVILYNRAQKRGGLNHVFGKKIRQTVTPFSLSELRHATNNFNKILGKGGYGTVFKATLKYGSIVAVKRLDAQSKQGDLEFIREVELLSRLHHRHLVNLVGFCAEKGERMLVYEYMAMGSLYEHLHGEISREFPLPWNSRIKIAIHIALGLEYLHYGADPPLIHRDIKSANILLSEDGYCKVADFGLCKEAPGSSKGSDELISTATAIRGSFGYLDPEYVCTSVLSDKSDVYSYGVVLLELISGQKSIHECQPLAYWAEEYLCDMEKMPLLVDPSLKGDFDIEDLVALCDIARVCVEDQASLRPNMRDVAKMMIESLSIVSMGSTSGGSVRESSISDSEISLSKTSRGYMLNEHSQYANSYHNYSATLHWQHVDSPSHAPTTSLLPHGNESVLEEHVSNLLRPTQPH